jgi:hypothetical protein
MNSCDQTKAPVISRGWMLLNAICEASIGYLC